MSGRIIMPEGYLNGDGRRWGGDRWRGKHIIPGNCHPLVRVLLEEMNRQQTTAREVQNRAGLSNTTIWSWSTKTMPKIDLLDAALNVIDLELKVGWKGGRRWIGSNGT